MANKYSGFLAQIKVSDGGGGWDTIAAVRDIEGPGLAVDTIEAHDRDGGGWKEFMGGLKDGGEVSFDIAYDPAEDTHDGGTGLVSWLGATKDWRMALPASVNWDFSAILTTFQPTAPLNDLFTASITLKVTGAPTLA